MSRVKRTKGGRVGRGVEWGVVPHSDFVIFMSDSTDEPQAESSRVRDDSESAGQRHDRGSACD